MNFKMNTAESMEAMVGERKPRNAKRKLWLSGIGVLIVGFIIGILVGRLATCPDNEQQDQDGTFLPGVPRSIIEDGNPAISNEIMNGIKAENIRQYLKELTVNPHMAGTPADWEQANALRTFWKDVGLDDVFINEYEVLLSYPNTTSDENMNQIQIVDENGDIVFASPLYEEILDPSENKSSVFPPFNAYAAPGTVESKELIYVNYGRLEDYRHLHTLNINVSGKIVIARYGKIFRGDKVNLASKHGAIGMILYSDPKEYSNAHTDSSKVYPHDWWLPASAAQRGTVYLLYGDPLTPGYPSTEKAYRLHETDPEAVLPTIPVHPIGFGFAEKLLLEMSGQEVGSGDWIGAIPNVKYRYGGLLKNTRKIKMRISTTNQKRKTYNVIGMIRGEIEPDRYVILGNHRDAWVFGAIDPSSGTAVMKEVSRVMGQLVKNKKWRPRRTILFCSWGAQEYALIGSTEWVEQYVKNLGERTIAYLNVDSALQGNYSFRAKSTPLIHNVIFTATKKVPNPSKEDGFFTVYDKWKSAFPRDPGHPNTIPKIGSLSAGSDYAAMIQMVGVPSCDIRYTGLNDQYKTLEYPLYHTKYDTFHLVDQIMDREFKYQRSTGQVWAEMARHLSDTMILPLDVENYSRELDGLITALDSEFGDKLRNNGINFDDIRNVANILKKEAKAFTTVVNNVDRNNPLAVRRVNDQLMLFDRAFVDPRGLPGRPNARHILFGENSVNHDAGRSFPGLVDTLYEIHQDQEDRWNVVKKHFSVIIFTIESATTTLRNVTGFISNFKKN